MYSVWSMKLLVTSQPEPLTYMAWPASKKQLQCKGRLPVTFVKIPGPCTEASWGQRRRPTVRRILTATIGEDLDMQCMWHKTGGNRLIHPSICNSFYLYIGPVTFTYWLRGAAKSTMASQEHSVLDNEPIFKHWFKDAHDRGCVRRASRYSYCLVLWIRSTQIMCILLFFACDCFPTIIFLLLASLVS